MLWQPFDFIVPFLLSLGLAKFLFLSVLQINVVYVFLLYPMHTTCFIHLTLCDCIIFLTCVEKYKE